MAYFDRAQNRKNWEKMMVGLRAERARREAGDEPIKFERQPREGGFIREPVPFKQLMDEYRAEMGIDAPVRARVLDAVARQKTHEASL